MKRVELAVHDVDSWDQLVRVFIGCVTCCTFKVEHGVYSVEVREAGGWGRQPVFLTRKNSIPYCIHENTIFLILITFQNKSSVLLVVFSLNLQATPSAGTYTFSFQGNTGFLYQ